MVTEFLSHPLEQPWEILARSFASGVITPLKSTRPIRDATESAASLEEWICVAPVMPVSFTSHRASPLTQYRSTARIADGNRLVRSCSPTACRWGTRPRSVQGIPIRMSPLHSRPTKGRGFAKVVDAFAYSLCARTCVALVGVAAVGKTDHEPARLRCSSHG